MNETSLEDRAPEEFYKFVGAGRNTRNRLVVSNKDMFTIWGQNGFIASLFCLTYLLVWGLEVGGSKKKVVKCLVFLQRQIFIVFLVSLQFLSLTQLAIHDIRREREGRYIFSYLLSWLVTSIIIIEFIRAWLIVRTPGVTFETLSSKNFEKGLIKKYWTRHLNEKEKSSGNTYMLRDRMRWTLF